ncbi:MAG: helix-turn-helix transcriptional regulator [Magnetospirillum sp.]|nr:helix-turn-helix transcriptional regulator [Magnetospirillum sp.]
MRNANRRFTIGTGFEVEVAEPSTAAVSPWALVWISSDVAPETIAAAAITVRLSVDRLRTLVDYSPQADSLLNGSVSDNGANLRIDNAPLVRRIAEELRLVGYDGTVLRLFLQGKVIELLVDGLSSSGGDMADPLAAIIRDHLLTDPAHPPSAAELSARLGVSQRRLGTEFKDAFGMSIPEWLADWRLARGRDLVLDGSISVAEIAASLGYSHLSTFSAAFAKKFGVPPTRLRSWQSAIKGNSP